MVNLVSTTPTSNKSSYTLALTEEDKEWAGAEVKSV